MLIASMAPVNDASSFNANLPQLAPSTPWEKYDSYCPDHVQAHEPDSGEVDCNQIIAGRGLLSWGCSPAWFAPCSQGACKGACTSCDSVRPEKSEYTASIGILGLVVFGDGIPVLPMPDEATFFNPRTWFAWRPVVEIQGTGKHIRSTEGKKASSPTKGVGSETAEACWDGLLLGEEGGSGLAQVSVSSVGVLRFRILRSRATSILGGQERESEEVFTANLSMAHDFFGQGCPETLVRPIFYRSLEGDIRHVGHLHVCLKIGIGGPTAAPLLANSAPALKIDAKPSGSAGKRLSKNVRVPEDYPTIQAAFDTICPLPDMYESLPRIILNSGVHRGNVDLFKSVVLEAAPGASPIIEGDVVIEAGGEHTELHKLEVHGSVAARAGAPVISGCTILEGGAAASTDPSASSASAVAALTISGNTVQPTIEDTTIRQGHGAGVLFENGAKGTFRKNTVIGNKASGIEVRDFSTNPIVEDNHIQENRQHGILVHNGGSGVFVNNDIHRNSLCGIMLKADTGSGLDVTGNRVHENEQGGILAEALVNNTTERKIGDNEEIGPARAVQEASSMYSPR